MILSDINIQDLKKPLDTFWKLATEKALLLHKEYDTNQGSPVFTVHGKYTTRGWTEWTQGFQYGITLLIAEATSNKELLKIGKENTFNNMAHHLSHFGVHDHGFNNLSTYGNLLRMANQNLFDASKEEKEYYKLALRMSASVQAKRWTNTKEGGFIYSFNGPHSLFIDTIRTARIVLAGHKLKHRLLDENDTKIDLLQRAIEHALTTAKYAVFYGEGRDTYDEWGRVAHESIFNTNDGKYRCPNSQQGFSGFTTWTRGLAWAMVGFSEFLEFLESEKLSFEGLEDVKATLLKAAKATCDFYIKYTSSNGIPYWDTGAPNINKLGNYSEREAEINNSYEPIDSSAAAIGAQGLLRLSHLLKETEAKASKKYMQAGLGVLQTLLSDDYLATEPTHQGILKHSVYHWPNGWDNVPKGSKVPQNESSMWGDYHLVELCFLAKKISEDKYYTFFDMIH